MSIDSANVKLHQQYFLELFQDSILIDSLVLHIIKSRRLLSDHIELLETCHLSPEQLTAAPRTQRFTLLRVLGLLSISAFSLNVKNINGWSFMRFIAPVITTVYGLGFTIKTIFTLRREKVQNAVRSLNETIDNADSSIRKNISYFRETNLIKSSIQDGRERIEMVHNCLESIIELIQLIYADVKEIERIRLPEHIERNYQPLEELNDCIYFQKNINDLSSDDLKDFYNIFLYFQSQLLLRVCLLILFKKDCAFVYMQKNLPVLQKSIEKHIKRLTDPLNILNTGKLLRDKLELLKQDDQKANNHSIGLARIKRGSLDIMCRLIALTNEYRLADNSIQSFDDDFLRRKEILFNVGERLCQIDQSITACQDDFRRLILTYNKFLFTSFPIEYEHKINLPLDVNTENTEIEDENHMQRIEENQDENTSDYFALRDSDEDLSSSDDNENDKNYGRKKYANYEDELDNLDLKISRTYFAPVLKQLKTKINPIKDSMKERELKFLMAKGVNCSKIMNSEPIATKVNTIGSDSDSDVSIVMPRLKSKPNFDEMRSYLQQKQQFSLIPTALPAPSLGDEDILE